MFPTHNLKPVWIGEAVGSPRTWPVVIEHPNGFEPGVLHEIGGAVWRNEVPFRMTEVEAAQWAIEDLSNVKSRTPASKITQNALHVEPIGPRLHDLAPMT